MGKKGRKTRWRRLPIGEQVNGPESAGPPPDEDQEANVSPSPEHHVTFNEDEYTKITTPRQDVLFKKGYLGRRRVNNPTPDAQEIHSADSLESEYIPEEQPQFAYVPPTGFIDPTGVLYVNGGAYEIYDPYSGNITVVVGPAPQYPPQPVLAAMPCQPVPLTPLEWFNPPAPWACPYNNRKKRYSTDSQNCSAQSSESTGPPGSPQEPIDEAAGVVFPQQPQPYMYPGYMFGAPVYNMNGVNVQGVLPQSPVPAMNDITLTTTTTTTTTSAKRRKKRRRKRRGGVTDEGSESSCEEVINCDVGVCNQSGASSDAGQGSTCSKTNSDSGINTEPTPDSGSNTPPPLQQMQLSSAQSFEETQVEECTQSFELENETELELNSSSISTPETNKLTFESLPSEDGETLQELSCSSELVSCTSEHIDSNSCKVNETNEIECNLSDKELRKAELNSDETNASEHQVDSSFSSEVNNETLTQTFNSCLSSVNEDSYPDETDRSIEETPAEKTIPVKEILINCDVENVNILENCVEDTKEINIKEDTEIKADISIIEELVERIKIEVQENETVMNCEEQVESVEKETDVDKGTCDISSHVTNEEVIVTTNNADVVRKENEVVAEIVVEEKEILRPFVNCPPVNLNQFSSSRNSVAPVPPPRRRRSLYRSAEKVAKRVVEEAVREGVKEAACEKCKNALPITEAVSRWLQSQGPEVLSANDLVDYDDDEDEGIEEGEGSTNQKNVEGNPFLAPYLSGSRKRVAADFDDCGSLVSSAGEWDMYDHDSYTHTICDPAKSVDKYYRLGTDDLDDKITSSPAMIKTAVHIRRAGPFPCGVCCIIQ